MRRTPRRPVGEAPVPGTIAVEGATVAVAGTTLAARAGAASWARSPVRTALALLIVLIAVTGPTATAAQLPDSVTADSLTSDSLAGDTRATTDPTASSDTLPTDWSAPLPMAARTTLEYVVATSPDTPGGMGLLETAQAEARIALEHVNLAGRDSTSLANMTRHVPHVLHAIDPVEAGAGPGMGYGVRRAARAMQDRLEELRRMDDLPGVLRFHVPFALQAARGAEARATEAIAVARALQRATSAAEGRRLVRRLDAAVRAMAYGSDRDDDGRIGYAEDESGVAQIGHHLSLVGRVTAR